MATSLYRGTVALAATLLGPPDDVTALALTSWDHSFTIHGIQPLPTPIPEGGLPPLRDLTAMTDVGTAHSCHGGGGGGHPRFLWHFGFEPKLPDDAHTLTLSAKANGTAFGTTIPLPHWPVTVTESSARQVRSTSATRPLRRPVEEGPHLPDRVLPLSADMGVISDVRRVATHLYCWSSWFLLTVEAAGDLASTCAQGPPRTPWELEDDRGGHYHGAWTGGWGGRDTGAHIACAPGLDPLAAELRITFTDPFAVAGRLTAVVPVPTAME